MSGLKLSSRQNNHVVDILFTLALFCIFTASSLIVVLIGANVYKTTVSGMTQNYDMRTSLTYISQKVRQNDIANGVYLSKIGEVDALVLEQRINDKDYQTWIYHDNGSIKELFTPKRDDIKPSDGREIMSVAALKIQRDDNGIFTFTTTDKDGKTASVKLSQRCK